MLISSSSDVSAALSVVVLIYLVVLVLIVWAYIRIIRRTGYSGWWILTGVIPLLNVVMLLMFAFKEWPIQRELAQFRAMADYRGHQADLAGAGSDPVPSGGQPGHSDEAGYRRQSRYGSAWPDDPPR